MNAANLCPSPYPVQETVFRHTRDVNRDASFQNRGKFGALKEAARRALAEYVGASPSEIALTRNTSEGNNTVVNGLDLGAGDEVVLWDQNHPR
jgi:selenocysteine lyase/cysteine desulfurase